MRWSISTKNTSCFLYVYSIFIHTLSLGGGKGADSFGEHFVEGLWSEAFVAQSRGSDIFPADMVSEPKVRSEGGTYRKPRGAEVATHLGRIEGLGKSSTS